MEHTYLRYECADTFGITVASASSKAPNSNAVLSVVNNANNNDDIVLTTAGSCVVGFHLKTDLQPSIKLGHAQQQLSGGGTGRALNSDEIVCLDVRNGQVATGWVDGSIRIFELMDNNPRRMSTGMANSLLEDDNTCLWQSDALTLNGHGGSPVRTVIFDTTRDTNSSNTRLASGGSDGTVILWDIVAETGLYRLLGHRGAITQIAFLLNITIASSSSRIADASSLLLSSSLDGLIKLWDLDNQCCIQTIVMSGGGEILASTCMSLYKNNPDDNDHDRCRLVVGGSDGRIRVWTVRPDNNNDNDERAQASSSSSTNAATTAGDAVMIEDDDETNNPQPPPSSSTANTIAGNKTDRDDIFEFHGNLIVPPNVVIDANEKITDIRSDVHGRYVGVLRSKTIDVYSIRSNMESQKKRIRRLKRRQEKIKKKTNTTATTDSTGKSLNNKRGILDDDDDDNDDDESMVDNNTGQQQDTVIVDPERIQASDEFEYVTTIRLGGKVRAFRFCSKAGKGELCRIVCALTTNALEIHSIAREKKKKHRDHQLPMIVSEKINTLDFYGHPTGIRSIAISSDDRLVCTVSKNVSKIWNVATRSCTQSLLLIAGSNSKKTKKKDACYGLCAAILPGNTHIVVGTREGHLLVIDIGAGDIVFVEDDAHDGAIWDLDIRRPNTTDSSITIVSGSADKSVKFWNVESQEDDDDDESTRAGQPMLVHTRTLQMTDDVIAVKFSHSQDSTKRLVIVSTLDSTVKVFFDDSLKMYLSLYGHKLPALAVDCSDDDVLLVSGGADKTIKIWGLDFGDTHRTLHGHGDSITDLRFVRRTHNFFSSSKDGTVRYWDGDRFEQILLLSGHVAEVSCLAVSRTGAFVVSGGMDRQIRVWERTKDIVFLEEERERELEQNFDRINNRDEGTTTQILDRKKRGLTDDDNDDENDDNDNEPQSEAAVRKSVLSVASGDRIMEALERADQELRDIATFRSVHGTEKKRTPNLMMLGLEPAHYVLWVLRTIKSSEIEQSLIILSLRHVQRLVYYLIVLLKLGLGVELCSRVAVFVVKAHQNQIIATKSLVLPLRELRRLVRLRVGEARDVVGFDVAALKLISKVANERKQSYMVDDTQIKDVWAGLGLGSDIAAALEGRSKRR